jgi:hypothetical protein
MSGLSAYVRVDLYGGVEGSEVKDPGQLERTEHACARLRSVPG